MSGITTTAVEFVTSADGTRIGFDRQGTGPAVVLISGGSVDRMSNVGLAAALAGDGTILNYDRRGRGPSGDTQPYAIAREIEDLAAVIEAAGGSAGVYGSSSGAVLGLHAAAAGLPIAKLALWEPPFIVDDSRPRPAADTASVYRRLVAEGKRGEAVEYFMSTVVGLPDEFVAFAKTQPWWPAQEALAHTLAYDAEIMADYSLPTELIGRVSVPTLVVHGTSSFEFIGTAAAALTDALPDGRRETLDGQSHDVDPAVLAPVLARFFAG